MSWCETPSWLLLSLKQGCRFFYRWFANNMFFFVGAANCKAVSIVTNLLCRANEKTDRGVHRLFWHLNMNVKSMLFKKYMTLKATLEDLWLFLQNHRLASLLATNAIICDVFDINLLTEREQNACELPVIKTTWILTLFPSVLVWWL